MLRGVLLIMSLSLSACATMPPVPNHDKYGIFPNVSPPGFYGVNYETKHETYRTWDDPEMAGGQCLSAEDYKKFERYQVKLKKWGEDHCK